MPNFLSKSVVNWPKKIERESQEICKKFSIELRTKISKERIGSGVLRNNLKRFGTKSKKRVFSKNLTRSAENFKIYQESRERT